MRTCLSGLLLLMAALPPAAAAQDAVDRPIAAVEHSAILGAELESIIAALEPQVIAWRRDIHQHPELGNREFRTAALVAAQLRALGMDVQTDVAHTGVVGVLRGGRPGPVVALRADMDALPVTERAAVPFASRVRTEYNGEEVGVMHACGHDTHVAMLLGVAEALAAVRDDLPGTVKFIFQPAEEGAPQGEDGGAELMVREGVLRDPDVDAILALHIDALREVGTIGYRPGGIWASADDYRITVRGRQSHGAYPWMGIDPIVVSAQIITALQTIVSRQAPLIEGAAVVTVGAIRGGVRSNIIPEEVVMIGTIRALDPQMRELLHERVRRTAAQVAAAWGATAEIELPLSLAYPVTYNDHELTRVLAPVLEEVAGPGRALLMPAEMGAEDFSFFAQEVPGFYFSLGGRPAHVPVHEAADHHTPDFYIDESGLLLGVRAMTAAALTLLRSERTAAR